MLGVRTIVSTWKLPGEVAIQGALVKSRSGGSLLDSIEAGLMAAEEDPSLVAIGRGSLPNSDGEIELDASVMLGDTLDGGSVCAVRGLLPAISMARWVMERTDHVMLAGDQARRFGMEQGLKPQNLMTNTTNRAYQLYLTDPEKASEYIHTLDEVPPHDTVTMLGRDNGNFVAASSTSGMPFKVPGRVGDSPIIGAGIYADDEAGCAGATGRGEDLWKASASFRVVEFMRNGDSAQAACDRVIEFMVRRLPKSHKIPCVVLALDRDGGFGAAISTGKFDLWVAEGDDLNCHHFEGII
jgi:N4-(beta-N-acetylglucosaminyl)-L-asparaginase